ncbi:MAG: HD-GYP domain-containing protein [Thiohalocapsa sp.]
MIYAAERDAFHRDELDLLQELAGNCAYGIRSIRDRTARDNALQRWHASLESAIDALAGTVELRDPYTAGHQQRVATLAAAIGRELDLGGEQIQGLYLAGIVHDIGKIKIPAEILSRPGQLSDIELALIKTHPQAGHDILKGVDFPWPIAQMVLQHHERLDGSGYPNRLRGDDILLEARILAVADVAEAMMSHRPYRPALGLEAALREVEAHKGRRYDARVADACIALFGRKGFRFDDAGPGKPQAPPSTPT